MNTAKQLATGFQQLQRPSVGHGKEGFHLQPRKRSNLPQFSSCPFWTEGPNQKQYSMFSLLSAKKEIIICSDLLVMLCQSQMNMQLALLTKRDPSAIFSPLPVQTGDPANFQISGNCFDQPYFLSLPWDCCRSQCYNSQLFSNRRQSDWSSIICFC